MAHVEGKLTVIQTCDSIAKENDTQQPEGDPVVAVAEVYYGEAGGLRTCGRRCLLVGVAASIWARYRHAGSDRKEARGSTRCALRRGTSCREEGRLAAAVCKDCSALGGQRRRKGTADRGRGLWGPLGLKQAAGMRAADGALAAGNQQSVLRPGCQGEGFLGLRGTGSERRGCCALGRRRVGMARAVGRGFAWPWVTSARGGRTEKERERKNRRRRGFRLRGEMRRCGVMKGIFMGGGHRLT